MYFLFFGVSSGGPPPSAAFIFKIDTEKVGSATKTIVIPTIATGTYDCIVDWGDGSSNSITTWNDVNWTHVYAAAGEKTISIQGQFEGFRFNDGGDKLKLLEIIQWGEGFKLGTIEGGYFYGCENARFTATDTLVLPVNCADAFRSCLSFYGEGQSTDGFDSSEVEDMSYMFGYNVNFNIPITNLNTSKVTTMRGMFYSARNFNQSVDHFDVSKVENFVSMFRFCWGYNQPMPSWITSSANNMQSMLEECKVFNQQVGHLDTSLVTNIKDMFKKCFLFNQDISSFDISSVANATDMLLDTAFSTTNDDLLLVAWEGQTEKPNVTFHAGTAKYSAGAPATARTNLVTNGWIITDGGPV
jgi:surface protein